MKVIAIIAAYNEADIIGPAIAHLIAEGVSVYLLDDGSTDGTCAAAEPFLGKGLLNIERLAAKPGAAGGRFRWRAILERKQQLARELDADWFIHHDADEFRESPWEGVSLVDAISRVEAAGYNAVDFALLNFRPTGDAFVPGSDPRPVFRMCEPGDAWDRLQIKCWKKTAAPVDLASSGGHDVTFDGRRVFPIRFLLRHYPIRGQAHGRRKVFGERRPRIDPAERALGWHVQYDGLDEQHDFTAPSARLVPYDATQVRLELLLRHRDVEQLEIAHTGLRDTLEAMSSECSRLKQQLADETARRVEADARSDRFLSWGRELERAVGDLQRRLDAVHQSKTWRWTAPIRRLVEKLSTRQPSP